MREAIKLRAFSLIVFKARLRLLVTTQQRIIITLIQATDFIAVQAFLSNL
jgi:hypothetical protein